MTVRELIEKLKEYRPELTIEIQMWDGYYTIRAKDFYVMSVKNPQHDIVMIDTTNLEH